MKADSTVSSFTKVEQAESLLASIGWDVILRLLDSGQIEARAHTESNIGYFMVSTDSVLEISGHLPHHLFGILVLPPHSFFRTDHPPSFDNGSVAMLSPDTSYRIIFEKNRHEAILFPSHRVKSGMPPTEETVSALLHESRFFERSGDLEMTPVRSIQSPSSNQDELVEKVCHLIDENRDFTAPSEISRTLNVGIRTLERAFSQSIRMPPSRYLAARRLNKAFRSLNEINRKDCSVTEIAMENCFSHLGRFSLNYRTLFGESPRDTLKRTRARSQHSFSNR